jgi:hypothetical protein
LKLSAFCLWLELKCYPYFVTAFIPGLVSSAVSAPAHTSTFFQALPPQGETVFVSQQQIFTVPDNLSREKFIRVITGPFKSFYYNLIALLEDPVSGA